MTDETSYLVVRSAAVYRAFGGTPIQLLPDYCFSQALVSFGFLTEEPQVADDMLARPIWNILADRGARVGVIGWPLTQPAPRVAGFMISDAFHRLSEPELNLEATPAVWPSVRGSVCQRVRSTTCLKCSRPSMRPAFW